MRRLLLLIATIIPFQIYCQCIGMSGTYTIGGVSPNFATISAAVTAVTNSGVCGPVIFDIRNGIYNEQINIYNIPGTDAINTVTFQAESGDSSLAVIEFASNSTNNYVVRLNGCKYVIFNKVGIRTTGTSYTTCVEVTNTRSIRFTHCYLYALAQGLSASAVIYTNSSDSLVVDHNYMRGSRHGYYPVNCHDQYILNNTITGQTRHALYAASPGSLNFNGNQISSTSTSISHVSLYIDNVDSLNVGGNKIETPRIALQILNSAGDSLNPIRIYNNMLISSADEDCAIIDNSCGNIDFYHNTINYSGSGYALYIVSFYNIRILNNIFSSTGTGIVYWINSNNGTLIDYNVVHAANDTVARSSSSTTIFPNFQQWQSLYGRDLNSVTGQPQFVSANDLHVTSDCSQNMACPTVDTLTIDGDGDSRALLHPFPGADEYANTGYGDDAGTVFLRFFAPITCSGSAPVTTTIRNFGNQPLTSCIIHWSINSVAQIPISWTGNLALWDTAQVPLGTITFTPHNQYIVESWTILPNGQPDQFSLNDSLGEQVFLTAFSGAFTIGGVNPDFATFTDAARDLDLYKVCGPVTFYVRDGNYNEQFDINYISGVNSTNTIRFTAENGDSSLVIVHFDSDSSGNNYIVRLNASRYVSFDHLSFRKDGPTFNRIVYYDNGVQFCPISNCSLKSTTVGPDETAGSMIYSEYSGTKDEHNPISYCKFEGGYGGVYLQGCTNSTEDGNHVTNCYFLNQDYFSIYLYDQNSVNCSYNYVKRSSSYQTIGIWIDGGNDSIRVDHNVIQGTILHGIGLDQCNWPTNNAVQVTNNFIALTTVGPNFSLEGISGANNTGEVLIAFNNIYLYDSINVVIGECLVYNGTNDVKIFNNNFNGSSANVVGIYSASSPLGSLQLDYNNYHVGGYIVNFSTTSTLYNVTSLSTLISNGYELNGDTLDPMFTSNTDLHVNQPLLCGSGLNISGITDDFDGDFRSATPTIGADEISGPVSAIQYSATGCAPQTIQFNAGGSTNLYSYSWDFGDPTTTNDTASIPNPTYTYNSTGTYTVTLQMIGISACGGSDSTSIVVNLNINGPTITLSGVLDTVCIQDGPWFLSGALPLGGTYSGNGVSGGFFTPSIAGMGDELITYTYTDSSGCMDTASFSVNVDLCFTVDEINDAHSLVVYPNPASEKITVEYRCVSSDVTLEIVNNLGQVIYSSTDEDSTYPEPRVLDISFLPSGIYQLRVTSQKENMSQSFIKE